MSNLTAEKLLRTGKKGDKKEIRSSLSVYDRTLTKPKLLKRAIESEREADEFTKEYLESHPKSFLVIVREVTSLEVVKTT